MHDYTKFTTLHHFNFCVYIYGTDDCVTCTTTYYIRLYNCTTLNHIHDFRTLMLLCTTYDFNIPTNLHHVRFYSMDDPLGAYESRIRLLIISGFITFKTLCFYDCTPCTPFRCARRCTNYDFTKWITMKRVRLYELYYIIRSASLEHIRFKLKMYEFII